MVGASRPMIHGPSPVIPAWAGGSRSVGAAVVFLVVLAALLMAVSGPAMAADGDLTPEQQKLAAQIDGKLIAPCCWTQTVAVHDSQKAEEVKMQVRLLLAQGKEESEIMDIFVAQYGEQILAAPRAGGFNLLAYLLPFAALVVGLGGIAVLAGRWRGGRPVMVPVSTSSPDTASGNDAAADLRRRLEEDLSHFDS